MEEKGHFERQRAQTWWSRVEADDDGDDSEDFIRGDSDRTSESVISADDFDHFALAGLLRDALLVGGDAVELVFL